MGKAKSHLDPSGWTDEEISRYATLRAIEWSSWPTYLSMGVGSILVAFVSPILLGISIAVVNVIWLQISPLIYVYRLSDLGVYINMLKWVSAPVMAALLFAHHDVKLAVIALLWPLISLILGFPNSFIAGAIRSQSVGKIEQKIYAAIQKKQIVSTPSKDVPFFISDNKNDLEITLSNVLHRGQKRLRLELFNSSSTDDEIFAIGIFRKSDLMEQNLTEPLIKGDVVKIPSGERWTVYINDESLMQLNQSKLLFAYADSQNGTFISEQLVNQA